MTLNRFIFALVMGMALPASLLAAALVIKEPEVRAIVAERGYRDPIVIERDGDFWRVVSYDNDSAAEVTVFVDERGEVLGAADVARTRITETTTTTTTTTTEPAAEPAAEPVTQPSSVATIVRDAGFHNVHDIAYLDNRGVWKAEADDITGSDFELHVDPNTGMIVHVEDD
jgi:hypothetical protein